MLCNQKNYLHSFGKKIAWQIQLFFPSKKVSPRDLAGKGPAQWYWSQIKQAKCWRPSQLKLPLVSLGAGLSQDQRQTIPGQLWSLSSYHTKQDPAVSSPQHLQLVPNRASDGVGSSGVYGTVAHCVREYSWSLRDFSLVQMEAGCKISY